MDPKSFNSPVYGTGEIIAHCNGEIVVIFLNPPGMKHVAGPQVCPIIHVQESNNGK